MRVLPGTPVDRLLTAALIVAPVIYLLADLLYATRGWDDPAAAVLHILGAVGYTFVLLRLVSWADGRPAAALLLVGALGVAGNVAYGFNTIHVWLGDTDLVDAAGAAVLIKPLGLCFPLMLLLAAAVLRGARPAWFCAVLTGAGLGWPIAHIANIGWLAVAVNLALVGALAAPAVASLRTAARPAPNEPGLKVP